MLAIAVLALFHLACAFIFAAKLRMYRRLSDMPVSVLLLSFLSFYGLPIAIGWVTGYINTITIIISAAIPGFVAVMALMKCKHVRVDWQAPVNALRRFDLIAKILFVILAVYILIPGYLGANLPIRSWDAVGYHSLSPMRWAVDGRFVLETFGDPHLDYYVTHGETFPNAKAVLPFIVLWWTGGEEGTALVQWPFLLLLCASCYATYRRLNLSHRASLVALFFIILAPEIFLQSVTGYADLQFVAGQLAIGWILLVLWQEKLGRSDLVLAASAFAVLAGAKPNALLPCGVLGLFYLVLLYRGTMGRVSRKIGSVAAGLFSVVIVSLFVAGPWYLHAWTAFSNPVFPIEVAAGETVVFPGIGSSNVASEMLANYQKATGLEGWWIMMNEHDRLPVIASWAGGLGSHTLILGLPSLVLFLIGGWWRNRRKDMVFVCLLMLLLVVSSPVLNWARMILFELFFYGFAFVWIVQNAAKYLKMILLFALFFLCAYDQARVLPTFLYRFRIPELAFYPILTSNVRPAMTDDFPASYTALDYWREAVAQPGDLLALPNGTIPVWHARPLTRNASVVRIPKLQANENTNRWRNTLLITGATHFYAPGGSNELRYAFDHPAEFDLMMWRLDVGAEAPWNIYPLNEGALFRIIQDDPLK